MADEKDGTTVWNEDGAGGSETEQLPPATQAAPTAWSDYQEDKPVREGLSWRQVTVIAAAIFIPLTAVAVMIINSWLQQPGKPQVVTEPTRVVTVPPAASPAPAAVPPPVTVTVPPPVTVTQAAPPVPRAAPPPNETFLICPDGHSGVATNVTSCEFAMNVRESYLSQGGPTVIAYSPVTGDSYRMECHAGFTSHLSNGLTVDSVRCVGGNDAVVILW
jgi:hypothetical protein